MQKEFSIENLSEIAQEVIDIAINHTYDGATVLALEGDLGAGKTALTQNIARILGVVEDVNSPTFNIMKKYKIPLTTSHILPTTLIHIDAYRLDSGKDLENLGWSQILKDEKNLVIIEWASKIAEVLPARALRAKLAHTGDTTRHITLTY